MKAQIYNYASGGFEAAIESNEDSLTVISRPSGTHVSTCRAAAKALRAAADQFDKLALQRRATGTVVTLKDD